MPGTGGAKNVKVVKLTETDRERLLEYVSREPEVNLFFVGDIENYGLESETVSVYAFPDGDQWDCVLLRYFDMYIVYSPRADFKVEAAAAFLKERQVDSISGKTELVRRFLPYYPAMNLKETYLCRCGEAGLHSVRREKEAEQFLISAMGQKAEMPGSGTDVPEDKVEIRSLLAEECPKLVELYREIKEFTRVQENPEKAQKTMEADFSSGELAVGVFENGTLAAAARTSGSNSRSAMLVGVATRPGFRKKGYATAAVAELCRRVFAGGRQFLCLFYDNPEAGRIYHRIGFEEVGFYGMLQPESQAQ